jgi:hypothetical protein
LTSATMPTSGGSGGRTCTASETTMPMCILPICRGLACQLTVFTAGVPDGCRWRNQFRVAGNRGVSRVSIM